MCKEHIHTHTHIMICVFLESVEFNKHFIPCPNTSFRECIQSIDLELISLEWIIMWKLSELIQYILWNKIIDYKWPFDTCQLDVYRFTPCTFPLLHSYHLYNNDSRLSWWESLAYCSKRKTVNYRFDNNGVLLVMYEMSSTFLFPIVVHTVLFKRPWS